MARFTGLKDHQCGGRTALRPHRCGDSGKLATFSIVKYLGYEKPGEYADPKQEQFQIIIEYNLKNPKVAVAILCRHFRANTRCSGAFAVGSRLLHPSRIRIPRAHDPGALDHERRVSASIYKVVTQANGKS